MKTQVSTPKDPKGSSLAKAKNALQSGRKVKVHLVKNSKEIYKANRVAAYVPLVP